MIPFCRLSHHGDKVRTEGQKVALAQQTKATQLKLLQQLHALIICAKKDRQSLVNRLITADTQLQLWASPQLPNL